jgi:hypothetical protein
VREAYAKAMADAQLLDEASKGKMEVDFVPGDD